MEGSILHNNTPFFFFLSIIIILLIVESLSRSFWILSMVNNGLGNLVSAHSGGLLELSEWMVSGGDPSPTRPDIFDEPAPVMTDKLEDGVVIDRAVGGSGCLSSIKFGKRVSLLTGNWGYILLTSSFGITWKLCEITCYFVREVGRVLR